MLQDDLAELLRRLNGEVNKDVSENVDDDDRIEDADDITHTVLSHTQVKTLMDKFDDIKFPLINSISEKLTESFCLAASQQLSTAPTQANNLSDFEGLMQLVCSTDVNLFH